MDEFGLYFHFIKAWVDEMYVYLPYVPQIIIIVIISVTVIITSFTG